MKIVFVVILVALISSITFGAGYFLGIANQEIQPEMVEKLEEISDNILPDMLAQARKELNTTAYCEALQKIECELRKEVNSTTE